MRVWERLQPLAKVAGASNPWLKLSSQVFVSNIHPRMWSDGLGMLMEQIKPSPHSAEINQGSSRFLGEALLPGFHVTELPFVAQKRAPTVIAVRH